MKDKALKLYVSFTSVSSAFDTFSTTCLPRFSTKTLLCSIFSSGNEWIVIKKI